MYAANSLNGPVATTAAVALLLLTGVSFGGTYNISNSPLFITANVPPLTMLVLGRDHKLYYEAYNDASDLNGDGTIDTRYTPANIPAVGNTPAIKGIDYFGYFDSYKCYTYDSGTGRFNPAGTTTNKKCSGQWSGDFLNYVTTSRIDALRKVFYGGYRSTDTATDTVLQRAFIPQDAHSWGKEYTSIANDGYDIREYTPLSLPVSLPGRETRHLFANTTLTSEASPPLLRVLENTPFRVWEWLSIERPVAGSECATGNNARVSCTSAGSWQIVPSGAFSGLTQTTYDITGATGWPNNHTEYNTLVTTYGIPAELLYTGAASQINGSGNPYTPQQDYYLTLFTGTFVAPTTGTYTFAVDGDDAVEVLIDGTVVASWYGGHGNCNCQDHSGSISLAAGNHTIEYRHMEWTGGDNYYLYWQVGGTPALTDYQVRAKVCATGLLEENCQIYPDSDYKPVGLLQQYGENAAMKFGLLTGSYKHNTAGGVLRKGVSSITDEIDPATGQFTTTNGIIKTIDKLRVVDFNYSDYAYGCGWIATRPITDGECSMWGNPIAEMMYEGMRYFAGKAAPTTGFSIGATDTPDATLGLPVATWTDPYAANSGNERCAKPFQIVISDINPSYDTDQVPGSLLSPVSRVTSPGLTSRPKRNHHRPRVGCTGPTLHRSVRDEL